MSQEDRARVFAELHTSGEILVLPNAWDAGTARIFESAGARAIGTTSMGISASLGMPDVQQMPLEQMLERVRPIVDAVDIPVTADMEAGYGDTTEQVVASIERAVDCGIAGINIEDGTGDPATPLLEPAVLAEQIAAIRNAVAIPLVINARTDVYLIEGLDPSERVAATVARGNLYREAGADCVFVPGGMERDTIAELVREIAAPLNVVANPAISVPVVPTVPELQELGVARVSVGSGFMRATLAFTKRAAEELLHHGRYDAMIEELTRPGAENSYLTAIGRKGRG